MNNLIMKQNSLIATKDSGGTPGIPAEASNINVDSSTFTTITGSNVQDVLKSVDTNIANTKVLKINNATIPLLNFEQDPESLYTTYPYRGKYTNSEIKESYIPNVVFDLNDIVSGNYAPVSKCINGVLYIYAKEVPNAALTIPSVLFQ